MVADGNTGVKFNTIYRNGTNSTKKKLQNRNQIPSHNTLKLSVAVSVVVVILAAAAVVVVVVVVVGPTNIS